MINYRIIARVFGILLIFEGILMLLSALISVIFKEHSASPLIYSALITIVTGIIVFTPLRNEEKVYGNREGYIIVAGTWLLFTLFGTLPYLFSGSVQSFTDAFFESMSGFSTTGATVITDIESLPKAIVFWRSLTQWIGGMGIIFLSLYLLPVFKDINIQLSTEEFSGQASDKIHPKTFGATKRLLSLYISLTVIEMIMLSLGGMPVFDSVCHSFGTLSAGGFSTHNNSLADFQSPYIKIILTIFMFLGGVNMNMVYFVVKREFRKISGNNEFLYYTFICLIFSALVASVLILGNIYPAGESFINGAFHTISVITTTGYYTSDYMIWGDFAILVLFILMFTGGTTGSASGGIKIVRLMIMTKNSRMELRRLIHPNAVIPIRIDQGIIPQNLVYNVLVFVTLYVLIICLSSFVLAMMGYDIITSLGTAASMLGNIGPALGDHGPFSTYSEVPVVGKWFLSALMFLGRLELMSVLILFSRSFYRR